MEITGTNFPLGTVVVARGALAELTPGDVVRALVRHRACDWGELGDDDKRANNEVLTSGARLLSAYRSEGGTKFWIITEADRSSTTILLPEDY